MPDPRPVRLVDAEGREVSLAPEEATRAFRSGRYQLVGDDIPGRDQTGRVMRVDPARVAEFLRAGGQLASQEELTQERYNRTHSGPVDMAIGAGEGFVRGLLPGGAGTQTLRDLGVSSAEQEQAREATPFSAGLGEVAGATAPFLLTGGSSAEAQAAAQAAGFANRTRALTAAGRAFVPQVAAAAPAAAAPAAAAPAAGAMVAAIQGAPVIPVAGQAVGAAGGTMRGIGQAVLAPAAEEAVTAAVPRATTALDGPVTAEIARPVMEAATQPMPRGMGQVSARAPSIAADSELAELGFTREEYLAQHRDALAGYEQQIQRLRSAGGRQNAAEIRALEAKRDSSLAEIASNERHLNPAQTGDHLIRTPARVVGEAVDPATLRAGSELAGDAAPAAVADAAPEAAVIPEMAHEPVPEVVLERHGVSRNELIANHRNAIDDYAREIADLTASDAEGNADKIRLFERYRDDHRAALAIESGDPQGAIATAEIPIRPLQPRAEPATMELTTADMVAQPPTAPTLPAMPGAAPAVPPPLPRTPGVSANVASNTVRGMPATPAGVAGAQNNALIQGIAHNAMNGGVPPVGPAAQAMFAGAQAGSPAQVSRAAEIGLSIARGTAEGGYFGANDHINEEALSNRPLTAEGLLMAIGSGALAGGAMSAAFEGFGGLRGLMRRGTPAQAAAQAPGIANQVRVGILERLSNAEGIGALGGSTGSLARRVSREGAEAALWGRGSVGEFLNRYKSTTEGWQGVVGHLGGEAENLRRIQVASRETGMDLGVFLTNLEKQHGLGNSLVDVAPLLASYKQAISQNAAMGMSATAKTAAQNVEREVGNLLYQDASHLVPRDFTLSQYHKMRVDIDDVIKAKGGYKAVGDDSAVVEHLRDLRQVAERSLEQRVEQLTGNVAGLNQYKLLKRNFQNAQDSLKISSRAVAGNAAGNGIIQAAMKGGAAGLLLSGGNPAMMAVGIISGAAGQALKSRAHALAAMGLNAAARQQVLLRVEQQMTRMANTAVGQLFARSGGTIARAAVIRRMTEKEYGRVTQGLAELGANPDAMAQAVGSLAELIPFAPATGMEAVQAQARRLQYAQSIVPGAMEPDPVARALAMRTASAQQRDTFSKKFAVVANPEVFLEQVAKGSVTPESVEAVRAIAPALYAKVMGNIEQELLTTHGPLPTRVVRTIEVLSGLSVGIRSPESVTMLQASYSAGDEGVSGDTSGAPQAGKMGIGNRTTSAATRAQERMTEEGPGL